MHQRIERTLWVAVEEPRLLSIVENVLARLPGVEALRWHPGLVPTPTVGAVVCEFPSGAWRSCVHIVQIGGPILPHILILKPASSQALPRLLAAPDRVRAAVAACIDSSAGMEADLTQCLRRVVGSSLAGGAIALIEEVLAGDDRDLRHFVREVLHGPRHRTTLQRTLKGAGTPARRLRAALLATGFAHPYVSFARPEPSA